MNDVKGQSAILSAIGFTILLVSIIGATFAYFTVKIIGNDNASSINITAADVAAVTFSDGPAINVVNAHPGYTAFKTFTITSYDGSANSSVQYVINLVTTNADLSAAATNTKEFNYSLNGTASGSGTVATEVTKEEMPKTVTTTQIGTGTLIGNETHTYTFVVQLAERYSAQDYLQGLGYNGIIQISIVSTDGLRTWDETTSSWKKWTSS